MESTPLWELAGKSLPPLINCQEFHAFLKGNERKPDGRRLIDPNEYYLRLAVLVWLFGMASQKIQLIIFSLSQILFLFRLELKQVLPVDVLLLLCCSLILPHVLAFVPGGSIVTGFVGFLYFFGGASEKYLVLPILLRNAGMAANFASVAVLSLGKLKDPTGRAKLLLAADVATLWWLDETAALKWVGMTVGTIVFICALDRRFLCHKRRYCHLFELPVVKEFH